MNTYICLVWRLGLFIYLSCHLVKIWVSLCLVCPAFLYLFSLVLSLSLVLSTDSGYTPLSDGVLLGWATLVVHQKLTPSQRYSSLSPCSISLSPFLSHSMLPSLSLSVHHHSLCFNTLCPPFLYLLLQSLSHRLFWPCLHFHFAGILSTFYDIK